ncbi:MAG: DUF5662 family protein [Bacilli bacterium]|nr:DUF5662 family protein [Bacilli bacterium]
MYHYFKHLRTILKHRHRVIYNASHCGIFWHSLRHDLSKFSPKEFIPSAKYYAGNMSPIVNQRKANEFFSTICQHHSKRNAHHWEYWCDWFKGNIVMETMPWKYATECVCDMLSASYTYNKKDFKPDTTYKFFMERSNGIYMTKATREYISWCLSRYAELGFKGLRKKDTKKKYQEILSVLPRYEQILLPGAGEMKF